MTEYENDYHGHPNYFAIYIALEVLLGVSLVAGMVGAPRLEITIVFITAIIKCWLVVQYFMHLSYEPWLVKIAPISGVLCLIILYVLVYPDIVVINLVNTLM